MYSIGTKVTYILYTRRTVTEHERTQPYMEEASVMFTQGLSRDC